MNTLFDSLDTKPEQTTPDKKGFIFSDGGSRGNPGPSASGSVLYDEDKNVLDKTSFYCGIQTNNYAEYMGAIIGLKMALENNITDVTMTLDSKLLVEQLNGNWKVKNANIKPLFEQTKNLLDQFQSTKVKHTLRAGNAIADRLVNQELDRRR